MGEIGIMKVREGIAENGEVEEGIGEKNKHEGE